MATAVQGKFVDRVRKIAPNNNNGIVSELVTTVTGSVYNVTHVSASATSFMVVKGSGYKITPEKGGGTITQGNEIFAFINEGGSVINIYEQNTAGASNKAEMIGANTSLYFSFTYNTTS